MKKQSVINLTEYYYNIHKDAIKTMTFVLILLPLIFSTLISILEITAYIVILINTVLDGFNLSRMIKDVISWNATYNMFSLTASILKALCFSFYSVGLYGIVKYRLSLSVKMIYDIMEYRFLGVFTLGFLMGFLEWMIIKIPFAGPFVSILFTYITVYSIIIFLEYSNTKSVLECLAGSWKYSLKHLIKILMLDIYYLITPTIIGVGVIIFTQLLGTIMSLYFVSLFGILIGCVSVIKKLPKALLARIIYYLCHP